MTDLIDQLVEADKLEELGSQEIDYGARDEDSDNDTEAVRDKDRRAYELSTSQLFPDEVPVKEECVDIKYAEGGLCDLVDELRDFLILDLDTEEDREQSD